MNRVIAMTALHDGGECEAIFNGQRDRVVEAVREEMAQQKKQYERELRIERDRADIKEQHLARALTTNLTHMTKKERLGPSERAMRAVENAWAMAIGTVIVWGEALGLWVYEGSDWDDRANL